MKFSTGQIVKTMGVNTLFADVTLQHYLNRHINGDWGDLSPEDAELNNEAIQSDLAGIPIGSDACNRGRVFSAYDTVPTSNGQTAKLWIISEWNRSITTCLLPREY